MVQLLKQRGQYVHTMTTIYSEHGFGWLVGVGIGVFFVSRLMSMFHFH